MKDETSIFGAKPERLDRLVFEALQDSEAEEAGPTASLGAVLERPGGQIGRYKLLSVLGEGGMGIVYLAQQQEPIRRKVAVKVIKPGMDSKRVISRFEAERQALALLDHPNIAHVYDAGTTEAGRPYFVMEFVKGLSVTEHCDRQKLTIEDRLGLLVQVCQAVQHAHQKGIIHRDIKPSNILVSMENDRAIPKIIDFGVAKAVAQPLTERTLATEDSQLLGTPEYMSPEQADMASVDIDTRSDIYSLGVLLYVLLTGVLPFDSDTLREGGIENIRKTIRETDPRTPSTRLTKLGDEGITIAQNRRMEIRTLARHLRKELEWIPLKAMRKNRAERYRSASELADDIENYLNGAPLIAGPPTAGYRLRKFLRRHKALVGGIAAVMVVSVIGTIVSVTFAFGQARARAEAQLIADFLQKDVLGMASRAKIGEATVSYLLDAACKRLDEGTFEEKPLIEASIRETLAWTYRHIGEPSKAEQYFLRAIEIYQQHRGEEHPDTLQATGNIGWVYEDQGRYHDMERLWTKNLQIRQRVSGVEQQVGTMNALAVTFYYLGRYKEAESLFEKALQLIRSELREEGVWLRPWFGCNLARVYTAQGRYEEAEQLFVETFKTAEWPEEHISAKFMYTSFLADTYREQGRYADAERLFTQAVEALRLLRGTKHVRTLRSTLGLDRLYIEQGRFSQAEDLLSDALETAQAQLRKEHPITLSFMNSLAVLRTKQKQYDEAEAFFDQALKGRQRELGEDHPDTLESKNDLAVLYKEQGRYDEAEKLLLEAVEGRRLKLGDKHPHTQESWDNLNELYKAWGKPERIENPSASLRTSFELRMSS